MIRHKLARHRIGLAPVAVVAAMAMAACGTGGQAGGARGSGVPVNSDAAAYTKALKSMKPVTIRFGGFTSGPGNPTADASVKWGDKVTKMSGGKIKFQWDFGGAKVPLDKMADALKQGRIDMGMYIQQYQPDKWPVAGLTTSMSMYGSARPLTGRMAAFAAEAEFGLTWEPLVKEAEAAGIHPLYPLYSPSHDTRMMCAGDSKVTSLSDLAGKQVRVVDKTQAAMVTALGATPVSLTYPELFTGLQRGVVDCAVNSLASFASGGFSEVLDSWAVSYEPGTDFVDTPSGWGVSQRLWDRLPLAAQQLIWDTQTDMVAGQLAGGFTNMIDGVEALKAENGKVYTYDDKVTAKIKEFDKKNAEDVAKQIEAANLDADGAAVVDKYKGLQEKWFDIVTGDLGNPADLAWDTVTKADADSIDLDAFTEKFYKEVLLPHRPQ
ncbi:hypothetical protein ACH4VM_33425 [Streptomyces sp. NPDC020792]|uniref:hypothetical protein n=1 Tax=Streptomyces sp. NPDC020792 TaxID=3365089 RepID=UPI0037887109